MKALRAVSDKKDALITELSRTPVRLNIPRNETAIVNDLARYEIQREIDLLRRKNDELNMINNIVRPTVYTRLVPGTELSDLVKVNANWKEKCSNLESRIK